MKYNLRNNDYNNIKQRFKKCLIKRNKKNLMLKKIENEVINRLYENNSQKKLNIIFNLKKMKSKKSLKAYKL